MLCTKENPKINYDSTFDVLYYNIVESENDYSADTNGNIETFRDMETDEVTGYIVFNFRDICESKTKEYSLLRELFDIPTVKTSCGF